MVRSVKAIADIWKSAPSLMRSLFPNAEAVRTYYEGVFSTILLKDLALRLKLSDTSLLLSICRFLFENIGSLVAPKRIADYLNAQGRKCDVKTVDKYLNALMDCFVLYEARRFDIHGKAELARLEKYYLVTLGSPNGARQQGDGCWAHAGKCGLSRIAAPRI